MANDCESWPSASEYGDMQDGMLAYFNHQARKTDWYAEHVNERVPFNFRDFMVSKPNPNLMTVRGPKSAGAANDERLPE